jgi:hypothetical protein
MPKLFTDLSAKKMSAKDYINKKRNLTIYNDFGNTGVARHVAKTYSNGKLKSTINHSNLLYLTKGYYDHYQTQDISSALIQSYKSQTFSKGCNIDVRQGTTNYTGDILVNYNISDSSGNQTQSFHDTKYANVTQYGEIIETTNATLTDNTKKDNVNCFQFPLPKLHKKTC